MLQIAELTFKDIMSDIGYHVNSTLESIPIVNTVKNFISKAAQTVQVWTQNNWTIRNVRFHYVDFDFHRFYILCVTMLIMIFNS